MKSLSQIQAAHRDYRNRAFYCRTHAMLHMIEQHNKPAPPEAELERILQRCRRLETKYGVDDLTTQDEFEDGMLLGFLDALRWVLELEPEDIEHEDIEHE
jgi:hypothetical protein